MIEWLYSGQVKLTIPQCDDALLLAKQCKLEQLKEEIQQAVTKANSFGKSYSSNQLYEFVGVALDATFILLLKNIHKTKESV